MRAFLLLAVLLFPSLAEAQIQTRLRNICHVKGQEENTLHGLGLVVGLNGTGDGGEFLPAIRSLATALQLMGNPLGKGGALELRDVKNVALVTVTATVPGQGIRQGSTLDCSVASVGSAKSLAGGRLFMTPLLGPQVGNPQVYAFCEGPLSIEDKDSPTTGKVYGGCRLEADFFNAFTKDGKITLVLERNHASFQVAQEVADLINSQLRIYTTSDNLARALNQGNVEVTIPQQYLSDPVGFIAQVLSLRMIAPQSEARVVINEKTGSVVIGGNVTIGAAVITHRNYVIETGAAEIQPGGQFAPFSPVEERSAQLTALVEALNALKMQPDDVIHIIKGLDRNGKLHGKLIIE